MAAFDERHYDAIAQIVAFLHKRYHSDATFAFYVQTARLFADDNPNFDAIAYRNACGIYAS